MKEFFINLPVLDVTNLTLDQLSAIVMIYSGILFIVFLPLAVIWIAVSHAINRKSKKINLKPLLIPAVMFAVTIGLFVTRSVFAQKENVVNFKNKPAQVTQAGPKNDNAVPNLNAPSPSPIIA